MPRDKGKASGGGAAAAAAPPPPTTSHVSVPWHVCGATFITENVWDKRVPVDVLKRFRPAPVGSSPSQPCTLMRPGRITDPSHPAYGQCGLFAAKKLACGAHVCDYRGVVCLTEHESKTSDYTLSFVDEPGIRLTLDAEKFGNEARFINDYRGTGQKANVRFATRVDHRGVTHMGVFVSAPRGVAKGQELLLSYGKGFWLARGLLRHHDSCSEQDVDALAETLERVLLEET